ncbi:hypothetical protein H2204_007565 [Knufia peltigerae]|uniref:Prolyl endopeptidase n=1 Tax=Knufia peltigerae TaxID=1002370 RepID=A0AA39CWU8_9EURO|nr:hypothetical protein H2204_007565 [Knufia peltigerae]
MAGHQAHRSNHATVFKGARHGSVSLADPYHWMTDVTSPETQAFIEAESEATTEYLDDPKLEATRRRLQQKLLSMWELSAVRELPKRLPNGDYIVRVAGRASEHPRSYQTNTDAIVNCKTPEHDPAIFFDELSGGGAIMASSLSKTSRYWAFLTSTDGSDWGVVRFKDVNSGNILEDELVDVKLAHKPSSIINWLGDQGVFYLHCPRDFAEDDGTPVPPTLRFHRIGAKQGADEAVYRDSSQPLQTFKAEVSLDGEYVFLDIYDKSRSGTVSAAPVNGATEPSDKLNLQFSTRVSCGVEAEWDYIGIQQDDQGSGAAHIFWTSQDNGKVMSYTPETAELKPLVPSSPELTMVTAKVIHEGYIAVVYSVDVQHQIRVFSPTGEPVQTLDRLPFSTIVDLGYDADAAAVFVLDSSFCRPPQLWSARVISDPPGSHPKIADFRNAQLFPHARDENGLTPSLQTRQVFYESADRTKIPMFLTSREPDANPDSAAAAPVLLYIYGGFGLSVIPHFRPDFSMFMDVVGGTLAVANVRGGGEYGHAWYAAACGGKRQRLFDDVHAAARYLRDVVGARKVVLMGESMGGLNAAAAMVQRPQLFDAVILNAGVLDVLRRGELGLGLYGVVDVGDEKVPDDFDAMYEWAPLERLRPGTRYPPVLLTSGSADKLVSCAHSCKFTAAMKHVASLGPGAAGREEDRDRAVESTQSVVHLRIIQDLGHGGNVPTKVKALMGLERWLWVCKVLAVEVV